MMIGNSTKDFVHIHIMKRRIRTAPSIRRERYGRTSHAWEEEVQLIAGWNTDDPFPTRETQKDLILWSIWMMKSGMMFFVSRNTLGRSETLFNGRSLRDAKAAYKKIVKDFPRSKDIDYELPWGQDQEGGGE